MPFTGGGIGRSVAVLVLAMLGGTGLTARQDVNAGKATIQERINRVAAEVFSRTDRAAENIAELKAILALDPNSAQAHMLLGIAYRTRGTSDLMGEAAGELRQALALDPSLLPARLYLAHLYLDLARPERAREELQAALAQVPDQPQCLALLAETERQLGKPETALDLTGRVLKADPSFAEARYYQALALFDLGRRDAAIVELEQVVQSGGRRPEVYGSLGAAYLEAGRLDQAIASLTDAIKLDTSRPEPMIKLARAYRLKGQLARAEGPLKEARAIAGETAVSAADQQIQRDLAFEEGLLRLQLNQLAGAARSLRTSVDLDPNYGLARRYLAEVYIKQGLYARASEQAVRAEKLGAPLPPALQKTLDDKLKAGAPKGRE
jgi:tetratricopeptide (TPR) repeat protein